MFSYHHLKTIKLSTGYECKDQTIQLSSLLSYPLLTKIFIESFLIPNSGNISGIFYQTQHYLGIYISQNSLNIPDLFKNKSLNQARNDVNLIQSDIKLSNVFH